MTELRALATSPETHVRHALHAPDRPWPETNCYLDLWIELLHALGRDPVPLLGVGAALDWEGDHFTFLKPSAADIMALSGVCLHEMALWEDTAAHVAIQLGRGAVPLLEVDAFFLPDTGANAHRTRHTKTTIAIVAFDPARSRLEYLHNAGLFGLEGDDCRGLLAGGGLFPFAELARVAAPPPPSAALKRRARVVLGRLAATRSPGNPVDAFGAALPNLLARVGGAPGRVNALCFNTTRQLGSAFGLLADHLRWLGGPADAAERLSHQAKTLQFQLARSARRGRTDAALGGAIAELAATWERCMADVTQAADEPARVGLFLAGMVGDGR